MSELVSKPVMLITDEFDLREMPQHLRDTYRIGVFIKEGPVENITFPFEDSKAALSDINNIEVLVTFFSSQPIIKQLVEHPSLRSVKLIQSLLAGINNYEGVSIPPDAKFCNGGEIHLMPTAWHTATMVSTVLRQFPRWFGNTVRGVWEPAYHELLGRRDPSKPVPEGAYRGPRGLSNSRILVLGMGPIGLKTSKILEVSGARPQNIEGIAASVTDVQTREGYQVYSRARMHERLAQADIVICLLPGTPEAKDTIGAPELALMKSSAVIINTGRGGTVNEPAILDALKSKRIAYYATDVATVEPAGADWILHSAPDFLFTPHIAGGGEDAFIKAAEVLEANNIALQTGANFVGLVEDRTRGFRGYHGPQPSGQLKT